MSSNERFLGCGIYTFPQAARLLGVRRHLLRYWLGERENHTERSVIKRKLKSENVITFPELMELHFIKMFRDQGVSFQAIRKAAHAAAKKFKSDYPFTVRKFDTDGTNIFATLTSKETNQELIEELRHGQLVLQTVIKPFFRKLDYRTSGHIDRFWPSEKTGRIVLDPSRRFGQPIDAETGVPTDAIFQAVTAAGGQDPTQVAKWLDIPLDAVQAAVRFEQSLAL